MLSHEMIYASRKNDGRYRILVFKDMYGICYSLLYTLTDRNKVIEEKLLLQ